MVRMVHSESRASRDGYRCGRLVYMPGMMRLGIDGILPSRVLTEWIALFNVIGLTRQNMPKGSQCLMSHISHSVAVAVAPVSKKERKRERYFRS